MATIIGGTAGGQVLALVAAPVLSRLYSPADFGTFTVVSALAMIIGNSSALRFELAVPLPADERDTHSLVTLGLLATVTTGIVGTVVVAFLGETIASQFGQTNLMPWLWFVPGTSAVMGAYLVLNQLAVRNRHYGAIGRRNLFQSSVLVLTQVGGGIADFRPGGLILGLTIGQAVGAVSLTRGSKIASKAAREGRKLVRLRTVLSRYRRFPLVLSPSGLLNVMGAHVPVLLIAYYYGGEVAGWLGLSQRVLLLPVTLIGAATAQVYLGELVRRSGDDCKRSLALFMRTTRNLGAVALMVALALLVAGPWLFRAVFGPEWVVSGEYARALSIGLAVQLVASPLSQTLVAFEKTYTLLAWDSGRLIIVTGATAICAIAGGSALTTIWCFGLTSCASYAVSWFLSRRTLRCRIGQAAAYEPIHSAIDPVSQTPEPDTHPRREPMDHGPF